MAREVQLSKITDMAAPRVVDHLSPEPLYLQLAAILRKRIRSGELVRGNRLTEKPLAAEHAIARETARRALKTLEAEGLVRPLPKRGWLILAK